MNGYKYPKILYRDSADNLVTIDNEKCVLEMEDINDIIQHISINGKMHTIIKGRRRRWKLTYYVEDKVTLFNNLFNIRNSSSNITFYPHSDNSTNYIVKLVGYKENHMNNNFYISTFEITFETTDYID